jgi:methylated-DNA-[protein]-cysteine S-methyltransferase
VDQWIEVSTPIGTFGIAADAGEVTALHFGGIGRQPIAADPQPVLREAAEQLSAYFAGELTDFDVALAVPHGSGFEKAVWKAIAAIPYGETTTYGEIARAVGGGTVDAARAVGTACNHNPVPVIVPCHRVIGAGGKLVGFGGGLDRKRFLLQLEATVRIEKEFAQ